MGLLQLIYYSQ